MESGLILIRSWQRQRCGCNDEATAYVTETAAPREAKYGWKLARAAWKIVRACWADAMMVAASISDCTILTIVIAAAMMRHEDDADAKDDCSCSNSKNLFQQRCR